MSTCDTCKWWSEKTFDGYAARDCLNEKNGKNQSSDVDGLFAPHESSMEGWGFGVCPNPKFGCIHHEFK